MIAGLVLAAGAGTRLGMPKALVRYSGATLLDRAVATLRAGGCDTVLAVLGAEARRVRAAAASDFVPVVNPDWQSGMGSSLRAGLSAMPVEARTAVISLVDQPAITAAAVRRVVTVAQGGADIARADYDGVLGHPVAFARELWPEVAANAHGDRGARDLLRRWREHVVLVPCGDIADPRDVDTAEDLARLRAGDLASMNTEIGDEHQGRHPQ